MCGAGRDAAVVALSLDRTRVVGHGLASLRDNEHFSIYLEGTPATNEGGYIPLAAADFKLEADQSQPYSRWRRRGAIVIEIAEVERRAFLAYKIDKRGARHRFRPSISGRDLRRGLRRHEGSSESVEEASPRDLTVYGP